MTPPLQHPASPPAPRIGVLGPNTCSDAEAAVGREVGAEIARRGGVLLCGGLGGMMEAAAEGAKSAGGLTVGILPGAAADAANRFIDLPIPTGLGAYRNMLLVQSCDAVIAVRGGYGTLSEIGAALRLGVPVIALESWQVGQGGSVDTGIHVAKSAKEAVALAFASAGGRTATRSPT